MINPSIYTSQSWKIVFAFPAILAIFQSLLLIFIFKYDSPKYYKQIKNSVLLEKANAQIYKNFGSESGKLESKEESHEPKVQFSELFGPKYLKAFIAGCFLGTFIQLSGINSVIFYSSTIFTKNSSPGYESEISARIGT